MEEAEGEYSYLLEMSFLLRHYGKLSILEQNLMTPEERSWWLRRLDTENKRKTEANKQK